MPAFDNITIKVEDPFTDQVPTELLQRAARATLIAERVPHAEVTLVVTDDATMRAMNRIYRGVDIPTDVLSFPAWDKSAGTDSGFVAAPEAADYLGDILISYPYAAHQAQTMGQAVEAELALLTVHGILHLLGYDHATPEEEEVMWSRQNAILATIEKGPTAGKASAAR
ncbi:MAG TPA: rRNA maturation RNase YbeY [Anaerolineae bacterium]|nr:rRNA maturation RNase YbeY [Anaerolineae bacterium]